MNYNDFIIIIDCGHGPDNTTSGKCSPVLDNSFNLNDKTVFKNRFREGNFNRLIGKLLYEKLNKLGCDVRFVSNDTSETTLSERVKRANNIYANRGNKKCLFISVHANAAGNATQWLNARGLSVHVARKCSATSEKMAQEIYKAGMNEFKGNRSVPKDYLWRNDFYVVKNTKMPAVLVENLFYDNKDDLRILMSDDGREKIATYIYVGLVNTMSSL